MNYYIGIDGGGTKTHCLLCSSEGKVLFETFGGPSNFLMIGTEEVCETVYNLIAACLQSENITWSDIASVVLGTTGAGRRSDAETFEKAFAEYLEKKEVSLRDFHVESDARAALEGAFSGNPGSILIAGTGSIMFGKKQTGEIVRVGGFGRFIGDEGSGFMLGKKGLIAAAKQFDGRGP
jgi:N-acetylglucosamine kinase-like BadF-type ATPase